MANNNNSTAKRGSYICKIGDLDIYQKFTYQKEGVKMKVVKHELGIYHAKRLIQGGFKTKDEAVNKANELISQGIKSSKKRK